jgi:hypothetical protein
MANNRMALVCKHCKVGIAIAKFYPVLEGGAAGWSAYTGGDNYLNDFFDRHKHEYDYEMYGGQQHYLAYEDDEVDWQYEKLINQP